MIYTPQMRAAVKSVKPPHDFQVDVIEYDFTPPYIGLRFYESHWRYLSEFERLHCIEYLSKIKKIIESYGVNVTIDPVYDTPGGQKVG
jgi:hypothetical protein